MSRTCECGADISDRSMRAIFCHPCADERRRKAHNARNRKRYRRAAEGKKTGGPAKKLTDEQIQAMLERWRGAHDPVTRHSMC